MHPDDSSLTYFGKLGLFIEGEINIWILSGYQWAGGGYRSGRCTLMIRP